MASNDQAFKAGELKGHTQEKATQMMEGAKDTATGAKDKAFEGVEVAKDKTSEVTESTKEEKPVEASERGVPVPQKGLVQATTEGVMGAAAGAADAVKRTLGMDDSSKKA